jgi:hypothetical protein
MPAAVLRSVKTARAMKLENMAQALSRAIMADSQKQKRGMKA